VLDESADIAGEDIEPEDVAVADVAELYVFHIQ